MDTLRRHAPWVVVGIAGAFALAIVALSRGETINALWIVVAAVCVYLIAYRYYSLFIADTVLRLDPTRADAGRTATTTASTTCRPTSTCCSATTSRPSPAPARWSARCSRRRWAICPALLWILAGVVFAGAVQDFIILFISMRRDGRSLGELIRSRDGHDARA